MRLFLFVGLALALATAGNAEILEANPANIDASAHYLYYLHGGIVEGSDGRPVSDVFGPYEYREILQRFEQEGFVVISEIRPRGADLNDYAKKTVAEIEALLAAKVPAGNIVVVGASQGGIIASLVSTAVDQKAVNYIIIAGLFRDLNTGSSINLHGRVLSIYDRADTHAFAPEKYFKQSASLADSKSIVTETGRGHGLVYRPLDDWLVPTLAWIRPDSK